MPKHQEKVGFSHKYVAFLMFFATWAVLVIDILSKPRLTQEFYDFPIVFA